MGEKSEAMDTENETDSKTPTQEAKTSEPRQDLSDIDQVKNCVGNLREISNYYIENREDLEFAGREIDKLQHIILKCMTEMAHMKGKLEVYEKVSGGQRQAQTYAEKLTAPTILKKAVSIRPEQKVIIVKPKDQAQIFDFEKSKTEIMSSFDPRMEKAQIKSVRKTRTGVLIETESEKDLEKLQGCRKIAEKYEMERPRKRNPRLLIHDVPIEIAKEELREIIIDQNPTFRGEMDKPNRLLEPIFMTGKRNEHTKKWVIETDPTTRKEILTRKRLNIGWRSCKAEDYIAITRCYKCQGFDHLAAHCTNKEYCSLCAEKGHGHKNCTRPPDEPKCRNCEKANKNHNHSVLDKKCPMYKLALERRVNSTNYKENQNVEEQL